MELKEIKLNANDEKLILFLARYKIMVASDAKLFYGSSYYQKRLQELKNANYIRRFHKLYIKLSPACIRYLSDNNIKYFKPCKNKNSIDRCVLVSKVGVELEKRNILFIPSWEMKGDNYTDWSRMFIGETKLKDEIFLTYYAKNNDKYIRTMQFDINKDMLHSNVLVISDTVDIIKDTSPFVFPNKIKVLIMNQNKLNTLQKYDSLNINSKLVKIYNKNFDEADLNIADCKIDDKNIIFMPYLDTHKIATINNIYRLGFFDGKIEIITFKENIKVIKKLINESFKNMCSYREIEEKEFEEEKVNIR